MKNAKGFTLIELLIVVAIIAILAAIAVPNFLEAQTRAKISRAQADMRSVATGIEAYRVDWNKAPAGFLTIRQANNPPAAWASMTSGSGASLRNPTAQKVITTPVAYMTSLPIDPFTLGSFVFDRVQRAESEGVVYWYDDFQSWPLLQTQFEGYAYNRIHNIHDKGYTYALSSAGPMRQQQSMWLALDGENLAGANDSVIFAYDASNGTISEGFIGRTSKGVFKEVNQD